MDMNANKGPYSYRLTFLRLNLIVKIIVRNRFNLLFISLICQLSFLKEYLIYNVGIIPSKFYHALGERSWRQFVVETVQSLLLIISICFVLSCIKYITNVFYVTSRQILTHRLQKLYFSQNKYYILNTLKFIFTDNPDQRITQDVDKFCSNFSSIIDPLVMAPFTITYYSYNCFEATGWIGLLGIFIVFVLSVLVNKIMIKPIINVVVQQEKCEGFFRFKHMHVRSNAESIAFQDACNAELTRCDHQLANLIKILHRLYMYEFPLDMSVNTFNYIGSIISYLILAIPIFSGKYSHLSPGELGALISKNAFVSIYLIQCFTKLVDLSSTLSQIGGLVHRISEMIDRLETHYIFEEENDRYSMKRSSVIKPEPFSDEPVVELKNVTFSPPKETLPIVFNLSLKLNVGSNVLITGKSSSGKTSLFRAIKGLWPIQAGSIVRKLPFHPSFIFFLPQRPLLSDGTLLEQIVYPLEVTKNAKLETEEIEKCLDLLKFAGLQHILEKVGFETEVNWNWYEMLSPGETQRLSFVRLFYHKPILAFLDEATSALELDMEEKLYEKCKELRITVISIGHRFSLTKFHDYFLHLDGQGGWKLSANESK